MKILCGTDIIEINRVKDSIKQVGDRFLQKVYTKNEIEYCESKKVQKYQHYAARFAAKEATFKAISGLISKYDISWNDIEVLNDENGRPYLNLLGKAKGKIIPKINSIDITISHCKEYAVANVVILLND